MALARGLGMVKGLFGPDDKDLMDKSAQADDARTIADLDDRYKRARDDRRPHEGEWLTNLAFVKGQQWTEWSKTRQALYQKPAPPWRIRVTINLVQPIVRTLLGKINAQPTQAKVQATSDTPEANQDARAQDELIDHLRQVCKSEDAELEAAKWLIVAGTGIHHLCWDKSIGDEVIEPDTILVDSVDPMTGQPTQIEQPNPNAGQPVREPAAEPADGDEPAPGAPVHMGEIDHIPVSPLQFFPEPMAKSIDDMEWCFYVSVRPASYVMRKYGQKVDEEHIAADDFLQVSASDESLNQSKGVVLKTYWERPNDEQPDGRYVVFAGSKVLVNQPNPYPTFPLPFVIERDPLVPDSFWGRAVVADLIPLQRAYNKLKSQAAEIRESTARPKWHAFKNALDAGQAITTAPAEVIVTNYLPGLPDGGKPTKIEGGDVPASFAAEAATIEGQFFEIAGLHDFRRGLQGMGLGRSFAALNLLLEQDDTRIGLLKREHDKAVVAAETAMLRLAKQFYQEPRTVTVLGRDDSVEVHQFYADKIADDPQVRIIASGQMPTSLAARQQYVFELRKEGIVTDPRSVRSLLGLANMPGINDELDRDIRQAERENELLKAGIVLQAHDYDNHLVHGQEHDAYRKGEEYEQLVAQQPNLAILFAQHMETHKALIAQAMQQSAPPPLPVKGPAPLAGVQPAVAPVAARPAIAPPLAI